MDTSSSFQIYAASTAVIAALLYFIYRYSFPKPIAGIPYAQESIRAFGDIPYLIKSQNQTKEVSTLFKQRLSELQAPVIQLFIAPFGKPLVVVADPNTAEDILISRTKEFDTSPLLHGIFTALVPNSMICMQTKDPSWKAHRRLMAETMSTSFLRNAAGPRLAAAVTNLVNLWTEKIRLAKGNPIDGSKDIADVFMESAWAQAFGESLGEIEKYTTFLKDITAIESVPKTPDSPIEIPISKKSEEYEAIFALSESSEIALKSPLRATAHKFAIKFDPTLRKAMAFRDRYIGDRLAEATKRFTAGETEIRSATDVLVEKEFMLANKEGRPPIYDSKTVRDELFLFILGAHDTTATTMEWALKFLTAHQNVQGQLREELISIFGDSRLPDAAQILEANLPCLDSFIQEVLRVGGTGSFVMRETQVDADILGHTIPAKTQVFMLTNGPGYLSPPFNTVNTDLKVPFTGAWDSNDLASFKPSRWIIDGKFDPRAGPLHTFSVGPRACFGKRMALMNLRLILTMIVLNFRLDSVPAELLAMDKAKDVLTHHPQTVWIRPALV